jgi:putative ABC transport system ATP-binding protein
MAFIEIENLKFSYSEKSTLVLDIADLKIQKGESVFIYGPSGTGKTTLLELLSGILSAQEGSIIIDSSNLLKMSSAQRDHFRSKKVGYVFQSFNLIPYLNVKENILLPLQLRGESVSQDFFKHLIGTLGISTILDSRVTEISMGQQQRVAVARALLSKPELLLADEPTSALDYDARERFLKLLFELCQENKVTLIFVSHDRSLQNLFQRHIDLSMLNGGRK